MWKYLSTQQKYMPDVNPPTKLHTKAALLLKH